MLAANPQDRLAAARRALTEASHAVGLPLAPSRGRGAEGRGRGPFATGIDELDRALGGGLPRGRLVEVVGTRSSGRLSLLLSLLSRALHAGEHAALVDAADALDPRALHPDDRQRLLWVRPGDALTALKCADLLLDAGGFALVAVYLVGVRARGGDGARAASGAAWARLARRAERAQASVLVTADGGSPLAPGAFAHVGLEVRRHRAAWRGRALLESVEGEVLVRRGRGAIAATGEGASGAATSVVFHGR